MGAVTDSNEPIPLLPLGILSSSAEDSFDSDSTDLLAVNSSLNRTGLSFKNLFFIFTFFEVCKLICNRARLDHKVSFLYCLYCSRDNMDSSCSYHYRSDWFRGIVSFMEHGSIGLDLGSCFDALFCWCHFDFHFSSLQLLQIS